MSEKLQKVLARVGLGSRRLMEQWISQGRVTVNGCCAKLGDRVEKNARICIDGKPISGRIAVDSACRVLAYNKPLGEISSRKDDQGRPTVFEHLPRLTEGRWVAIGRLDVNTSGLLLFTNNGDLANKLMHPSSQIEREYAVRVYGEVERKMLMQLRQGIELDDGFARFEAITYAGGEGTNHWYHVILQQGRNRLVRRLWEAMGVKVSRLIRIRYGCISLVRSLRPKQWLELEQASVDMLRRLSKRKQ